MLHRWYCFCEPNFFEISLNQSAGVSKPTTLRYNERERISVESKSGARIYALNCKWAPKCTLRNNYKNKKYASASFFYSKINVRIVTLLCTDLICQRKLGNNGLDYVNKGHIFCVLDMFIRKPKSDF